MKRVLLSCASLLAFTVTTPSVGALLNFPIGISANPLAMPRRPVRSSNITSIGYDAASHTLEVEFHTGSVYQYYNVPESVYRGLMNASSHGSYLAQYVKEVYRYREVN